MSVSGFGKGARPALNDAARRAIRLWQTDGPARVARVGLRLAVSPVLEFGRLAFFVRELDSEPAWPKFPGELDIRMAVGADLPKLVTGGRPDPTLAERRFSRGDQCVVVVDAEGAVLHNRWVTTIPTAIPEVTLDICPQDGEAYFYDGYTRPQARGLGLDGAVRCYIFEMFRSAGFKRVYSYVRGDNRPGLSAATRWQTCIGEITFLRLRGLGAWVIRKRDDAGHTDGTAAWPTLR